VAYPNLYQRNGAYLGKKVQHSMSKSGWTTKVSLEWLSTCKYRINIFIFRAPVMRVIHNNCGKIIREISSRDDGVLISNANCQRLYQRIIKWSL
jgi:hypothetical protein